MPKLDTPNQPNNLLYIELTVLSLLLMMITWLSWQVIDDKTKESLTQLPINLWNRITTRDQELFDVPLTSPRPSPTILPLPLGAQTYNLSHGQGVLGPKMRKITIDPLSPTRDQKQTITVVASDSSPISSVEIEVITDNKKAKHKLELIEGTKTDGTWRGQWQLGDTYNYTYGFRYILTGNQVYDETMWQRINNDTQ